MAQAQPVEIRSIARARTLAIDVGGSGLKASVVDEHGRLLTDRVRVDTPVGSPPGEIVEVLTRLVAPLGTFDRVSVGFPGVVRNGRVLTAPNLDNKGWKDFDLARALGRKLGKPVRVANDADVQGLAVISGHGVEMVVTLGTGFGTGLYLDGRLAPHLELGHHPFRKGETYEEQLGQKALERIGKQRWRRRLKLAIAQIQKVFWPRRLYLGGGNARLINFKLPPNVRTIPNLAGILGGNALWNAPTAQPRHE